MAIDVKKELNLASIELVRNMPFYGHILVQLPRVVIDADKNAMGIDTFAVGKENGKEILLKLYVNKQFMEGVYENAPDVRTAFANVLEILQHEILHIVFGHLTVSLPDKVRSGVACDLSVNSYLDRAKLPNRIHPETKLEIPGGVFPEDYKLEAKQSMIWYYNQLLKNKKFQEQCETGQFGQGGIMSDVVDRHKLWSKAQEDPMLSEMCKDLVRKSQKVCKETNKWGSIPGDLLEQISDLIEHGKAVLPWQSLLRLFCASAAESSLSYTVKRRSKRYKTRPGIRKDDVLRLAIGVDTSGSISEEQLRTFFNELYWIDKNGAEITVMECDTQINRTYPYREFDGKVRGRGGTDLQPVLEAVDEQNFDALIFFTDFYAPNISKHYRTPVLWILSNCDYTREQYPYQWGQFIHIDENYNVRRG